MPVRAAPRAPYCDMPWPWPYPWPARVTTLPTGRRYVSTAVAGPEPTSAVAATIVVVAASDSARTARRCLAKNMSGPLSTTDRLPVGEGACSVSGIEPQPSVGGAGHEVSPAVTVVVTHAQDLGEVVL